MPEDIRDRVAKLSKALKEFSNDRIIFVSRKPRHEKTAIYVTAVASRNKIVGVIVSFVSIEGRHELSPYHYRPKQERDFCMSIVGFSMKFTALAPMPANGAVSVRRPRKKCVLQRVLHRDRTVLMHPSTLHIIQPVSPAAVEMMTKRRSGHSKADTHACYAAPGAGQFLGDVHPSIARVEPTIDGQAVREAHWDAAVAGGGVAPAQPTTEGHGSDETHKSSALEGDDGGQ